MRRGSPALVELGDRLRELRRAAGLTQAAIAAPFSAAYVSAIEHGLVVPSLPALVLLASRLGVEPADILAGVNFRASAEYTDGHVSSAIEQFAGPTSPKDRLRPASSGRPPAGGLDPGAPG